MSHPIFNSKVCKLGHTVCCNLIDTDASNRGKTRGRTTREVIAEQINAKLGLDPEALDAWDADTVKVAVRKGAFDTETRAFTDSTGRYGGIVDAEVG